MGVSSVIYANTGAYVALNAMLTAERYQRLLDSADDAELKKRLSQGDPPGQPHRQDM